MKLSSCQGNTLNPENSGRIVLESLKIFAFLSSDWLTPKDDLIVGGIGGYWFVQGDFVSHFLVQVKGWSSQLKGQISEGHLV